MSFSAFSAWVASFMRIGGSSVSATGHSAVLLGGEGTVGDLEDAEGELPGEQVEETEAYGVPCIVWRPRAPSTVDIGNRQEELAAEAMALRIGERLVPVAARDLRINRKFPNPKVGSCAFVGYGGGYLGIDDTATQESMVTLYVPYSFSGDTPSKAHCIQLDPDSGAVKIVQGDGYAIFLDPDNGITLRDATGQNYVQLKDGQLTIVGDVCIRGNLVIGNPVGAVPVVGVPPGSPIHPMFYASPPGV